MYVDEKKLEGKKNVLNFSLPVRENLPVTQRSAAPTIPVPTATSPVTEKSVVPHGQKTT